MPKVSWKNEHYVRIYQGAKEGLKNTQIARLLGVAKITFKKWVKKDPAVRDALEQGRKSPGEDSTTLNEYVYKRLPEHLQEHWDQLMEWKDSPNAQRRMDALFANKGQNVRQTLFLHALTVTNFNASEACRRVGISKSTLDQWKLDPMFAELLDQSKWHMENFLESALMKLVKKGETSAVIFANKTINSKRGYAEQSTQKVEVSGSVQHNVLDLNSLNLPTKLRLAIFEHIQKQEQAAEDAENKLSSPKLQLPVHVEDTNEDD